MYQSSYIIRNFFYNIMVYEIDFVRKIENMIPVSKIMGSKFGGIKLIEYLCTAIQQSIYLTVTDPCKKRTQRCV